MLLNRGRKAASGGSSGLTNADLSFTSGYVAGASPVLFDVKFGADIFAGMTLHMQVSANATQNGDGTYVTTTQDFTHLLTESEATSGTVDVTAEMSPISGTYHMHARWEADDGTHSAAWGVEITGTIVSTTTTLDPANRNTNNAQLSGGNLIVTGVNQGAPQCVRTTNQVPNPGKYYFEVAITILASGGHVTLGCSDGSFVFATTLDTPGHIAGSKGAGLHDNDSIYPSVTNDGYSQVQGGILQCCIKRTGTNTVRVWIGHNNTWIGDPSAETGGETVTLSAASCYGYVGVDRVDTATANFGATAFTYAKPTGATAWS